MTGRNINKEGKRVSNKIKKQTQQTKTLTDTQRHIMELRTKLNTPDPEEIHPFTLYKIFTYVCVVVFPLVPAALYRIWCIKSEFTPREQKIWTAVIITVALYMIRFAIH